MSQRQHLPVDEPRERSVEAVIEFCALEEPAGRLARELLERYRQRLLGRLEEAGGRGQLRPGLDLDAAATQFIGCVQRLVLQLLIAGDVAGIIDRALAVFDLYRHDIRADGGGDA